MYLNSYNEKISFDGTSTQGIVGPVFLTDRRVFYDKKTCE